MTSLRVVKLLPFFGARHGGSVAQARLICRELARRGHRVTVITSDIGLTAGDAGVEGCRVLASPTRFWHRRPPYLPPAGMARGLRAALADADLLCMHVGLAASGALGRRLAAKASVPYVYNAEGALDPVRLQVKRRRKQAFLACFERAVLRQAAALQAVTGYEAECLVQQGADRARVHVIANAVDAAGFAAPADGAAFRAGHGLSASAFVVLFLGRLDHLKGLDLALAAAAPLLRQHDARFLIAGPDDGAGAAMRTLAAKLGIADKVVFAGALPRSAVADALAAADVFALTSRSEGLPNAALEAAAAGVPLWLTEACHLPEVRSCGAGTVDPAEVGALSASLHSLFADVAWRRRCAQNARQMVASHFDLPVIVSRLERLYRSLCA